MSGLHCSLFAANCILYLSGAVPAIVYTVEYSTEVSNVTVELSTAVGNVCTVRSSVYSTVYHYKRWRTKI